MYHWQQQAAYMLLLKHRWCYVITPALSENSIISSNKTLTMMCAFFNTDAASEFFANYKPVLPDLEAK